MNANRVKKVILWIVGVLFGLLVLLMGLQIAASERVEVVELITLDEQGEEVITRLWVVDDGGFGYLRVGAGGSGWYSRIQQNNREISVTRQGETRRYSAVDRPEKEDIVNRLMREKYTWGDALIEVLVGGRESSIPIELQPL